MFSKLHSLFSASVAASPNIISVISGGGLVYWLVGSVTFGKHPHQKLGTEFAEHSKTIKNWMLDTVKVDCAKYGLAISKKQRFALKHLLNGINATAAHQVTGLNREQWNTKLRVDYFEGNLPGGGASNFPNTTPNYGEEARLTIVLEDERKFCAKYSDGFSTHELSFIRTGLLHHPKYLAPLSHSPRRAGGVNPMEHGPEMVWHPYTVNVIYCIKNSKKNDYDVYLIRDVFVICKLYKWTERSGSTPHLTPFHFEEFVLSRVGEGTLSALKRSSTAKLQQRSNRAVSFDRWLMMNHVCINRGS